MNKFEHFACGQVFHSYPYDKSFKEILEILKDDNKWYAHNVSLEDTENEEYQLHLCEKYENESAEDLEGILNGYIISATIHFGTNEQITEMISHDE